MKLSKKERDDRLIEWMGMDDEDKMKYNGWIGFCKDELFNKSNAFMEEDKVKLKLRLLKEKNFRDRKLNKKKKNEIKRKINPN